jgi:uncharacterized protein YkwD
MSRILSCILVFLFLSHASFAQKNKKGQSAGPTIGFDYLTFNNLLLQGINKFRVHNNIDTLVGDSILQNASDISSSAMAGNETADSKSLHTTTPQHILKGGGSNKGEEVIIVTPLGKGKNQLPPDAVVKVILAKWTSSLKEKTVILNSSYTLAGISCGMDEEEKRAYVSVVLGNFQSHNAGAKHKKELKAPFNTKSKKLLEPDPKHCKNCDKFKDFENLQAGLSVEVGKVYLTYNNAKNLKRLLKKSTDALAIDIVQKEQFSKENYNIMDNSMRNKGVMLKPMNIQKILAKNINKPKKPGQKPRTIMVEMGKFPPNITGPYELNLLIIQDGYVCRTVLRSYMEYTDQESSPIEMQPMPDTTGILKQAFEPRSESALLTFTIPFEKNKSDFKKEDVQPFINALQEPDFIIDGLYIYAFSSIEGDSVANSKLQKKRAESVVKVLQQMQQTKITPAIVSNDSWGLFMLEMEDGKYDYLAKMSKREAINKINHTAGLSAELEPTLSKERFANVVMDVTYDISGSKEEKFSVVSFNRAVKAGNVNHAYKILDFIAKKIIEKKYSYESFDKLEIPAEAKNVGLLMNKIYYYYLIHNKVVDEEEYKGVLALQKLDTENPVVNFNALFCKIELDSTAGNKTEQVEVQQKIDALYKTHVPKKLVDALNIEWQFKIMDALDTLEGAQEQRQACIDKIKGFYNFKEASKQNAVKLAYAFARAKEFAFACSLLEPHLNNNPDEKLLLAYVSIASHVPVKFYSHKFSYALAEIKKKDPAKYCKMFGAPFMSFQVLENPDIKKVYREAACAE